MSYCPEIDFMASLPLVTSRNGILNCVHRYHTVSCLTVSCLTTAPFKQVSDSNSSISGGDFGSGGTSSSAKGSNSKQRMLASQCNDGGNLQPCFGPEVRASSSSN